MDQDEFDVEVNLGPGHIVLDGDPAPPQRGRAPQFSARLLWQNGWMNQDATWYRGRPGPRTHCIRWGPSSPPETSTVALPPFTPSFWPMSIVGKRSPISGTAEQLLY